MASASSPQPERKFEDPLTQIPPVKKFKDLKKFLKTRQAVLNMERPYLLSDIELKIQGLMGPWTFNLTQSLLDSLPGMLINSLLWVFYATESTEAFTDPVLAKLSAVASPLLGPFTLLVLVYATAFACLPAGYANRYNWHAAARKYLYYDGAYGLWPQLILATATGLASIPPVTRFQHHSAALLANIGTVVFWIAFFWAGIVTVTKVRSELFDYDYLNNKPDAFVVIEAPSFKFYAITLFGLPVLFGLILTCFNTALVVAIRLVHMLRS